MTQNNNINRISLCIDIIKELKATIQQIDDSTKKVKELSEFSYKSVLTEDNKDINDFLQSYSDNIEKINAMNNQITSRINKWYDFIKHPTITKHLFFPLIFFKRRTELKYYLKRSNLEIEKILISNRIIKEKLLSKENSLKSNAEKMTKDNKEYKNFIILIQRKKQLINDIIYLLPTIPDYQPSEININQLDKWIEQLKVKLNSIQIHI